MLALARLRAGEMMWTRPCALPIDWLGWSRQVVASEKELPPRWSHPFILFVDHRFPLHAYSPLLVASHACLHIYLLPVFVTTHNPEPISSYPFLLLSPHCLALSRLDLWSSSLRIGLQAGWMRLRRLVCRCHHRRPGLGTIRGLLFACRGEASRGQSLPRDAAVSIIVIIIVAD